MRRLIVASVGFGTALATGVALLDAVARSLMQG